MAGEPEPLARRRQLGAALRQYRLEAGMSVRDVAERLLSSPSKISRLETAQRNISLRDVRDLCDLYGVTGQRREQLMRLAEESRETAWWQSFDLDPALARFVGLEGSAVEIKDYQLGTVPGLLQTRDYAAAIIGTWVKDDPVALGRAVKLRMRRQQALTAQTKLHAIIDESVVRRLVGSREIVRDQLLKLIAQYDTSNVELQMIPFRAGATKGMISGFVALRFADSVGEDVLPSMPDIVYLEGISKEGVYVEKPEDVQDYLNAFEELMELALSERETKIYLQSTYSEM